MTLDQPVSIGVIGGTGLYDMDLEHVREISVSTPYGEPSDVITIGELGGTTVAFLPRHGRGHRITPSEVPARANIYALKQLGVQRLISVSAVGSLKEEIEPLHIVIPDQIIDRTRLRESTFFGDGLVVHVQFADPFCPELSDLLFAAIDDQETTVHRGGALVVIEGPAFSTRAESHLYRSWDASIIGMTALPEAKLAREAEMCYAALTSATDYDVWHNTQEDVSVEVVIGNLQKNAAKSREALRRLIPQLATPARCDCNEALRSSIVTAKEHVPQATLDRLGPLVAKYMN